MTLIALPTDNADAAAQGAAVCKLRVSGGRVALLDAEDFSRLAEFTWIARANAARPYVYRYQWSGGRRQRIYLHNEILEHPAGTVVDHINRNCLDNRRANLRAATQQQNCINRSPYAGRRYKGTVQRGRSWRARVKIGGKLTYLGSFATEEAAAEAYNAAVSTAFGAFACLNEIGAAE